MVFFFFNIGLGNGLRNRFAEVGAKGEHLLAKTFVITTYKIHIGVISLLFFCF